jgi:DNA-binding CsgD family transcriptional regulator
MRRSDSLAETAALLDALDRIRHVEQALASESLRYRDAVFGRLDAVLAALRDDLPAEQLIRNAADAVVELGFDRAIVSAVREQHWVPEWVSDQRDRAWSEEILQVGRADQRLLDGQLVESQLMARTPGIIVQDVQTESRVHDRLVHAARTNSYIAVPLVTNGVVTGFLHADCYYQRRDLDELDTRVLGIFAAALAQAMRRNDAIEQLTETRSGLRRLSMSLSAFDDDQPLNNRAWASRPEGRPMQSRHVPQAFFPLSKRELEVMRLVAEGHTNAAIGRRLVISEGTVKSHVNNIFRKLNAANRAELVTRWFGDLS